VAKIEGIRCESKALTTLQQAQGRLWTHSTQRKSGLIDRDSQFDPALRIGPGQHYELTGRDLAAPLCPADSQAI